MERRTRPSSSSRRSSGRRPGSRPMGDEQLLLALVNAARWGAVSPGSRGPIRPENDNWETKHDVEKIAVGGSGNIPKMREAIRYLRDPAKYDSEATWLGILTQERDALGFMAL